MSALTLDFVIERSQRPKLFGEGRIESVEKSGVPMQYNFPWVPKSLTTPSRVCTVKPNDRLTDTRTISHYSLHPMHSVQPNSQWAYIFLHSSLQKNDAITYYAVATFSLIFSLKEQLILLNVVCKSCNVLQTLCYICTAGLAMAGMELCARFYERCPPAMTPQDGIRRRFCSHCTSAYSVL